MPLKHIRSRRLAESLYRCTFRTAISTVSRPFTTGPLPSWYKIGPDPGPGLGLRFEMDLRRPPREQAGKNVHFFLKNKKWRGLGYLIYCQWIIPKP